MTQEHNMSLNELAERVETARVSGSIYKCLGLMCDAFEALGRPRYDFQDGETMEDIAASLRALSALGQSRSSMGGEG